MFFCPGKRGGKEGEAKQWKQREGRGKRGRKKQVE